MHIYRCEPGTQLSNSPVKIMARSCVARFDSWPFHFHVMTLGKLFTHMCLCHQAVFGTSQRAVMLYGWEGNRRSVVALAIHHRLSGIASYGLSGLEKENRHLGYARQSPVEHSNLPRS